MSWQAEVEQAVTGLGYEMVEAERPTGGLLRVFIENPNGVPAITVDDCERVTRQLQYVLEVQQVDYQRLEVSSPGLDRPLKRAQDYERFLGERAEITFKTPVVVNGPDGKSAYKQKKFAGRLEAAPQGQDGWVLVLEAEEQKKTGKVGARKKAAVEEPAMALGFTLDEVREARLVPVVDFKGKKVHVTPTTQAENAASALDEPEDKSFNDNGDRNR